MRLPIHIIVKFYLVHNIILGYTVTCDFQINFLIFYHQMNHKTDRLSSYCNVFKV